MADPFVVSSYVKIWIFLSLYLWLYIYAYSKVSDILLKTIGITQMVCACSCVVFVCICICVYESP